MSKTGANIIEGLVETLQKVLKAKEAETEARNRYGGMNWGYHGHEYAQRVDSAVAELTSWLDDYVDDRIAQYLRDNYNMSSIRKEEW